MQSSFPLQQQGFFEKPASKWLSLVAILLSIGICGWLGTQATETIVVLKTGLFTLPAAGYLAFRSFVMHA
jgi:hypothetical protein